jgi:hypothetical protein
LPRNLYAMDSCCMVGKQSKCTNIRLGLQLAQTTTVSLVMQQIGIARQLVPQLVRRQC